MEHLDGYAVEPQALTQLSGQLNDIAAQADALAKALAAVTASTGRPDSDEMGRLGPGDAGDLIGVLGKALTGDGARLTKAADLYSGADTGTAKRFRGES